jgi:hypothetical protein
MSAISVALRNVTKDGSRLIVVTIREFSARVFTPRFVVTVAGDLN